LRPSFRPLANHLFLWKAIEAQNCDCPVEYENREGTFFERGK
jgi:hypothetical protein